MSNKLTSDKLLSLAWEQSQMISDPYQKATIYLEMAELLYEKESDKQDHEKEQQKCDCEKEFENVKSVEKKKSSKEALKPAAEKASDSFAPDEPTPKKDAGDPITKEEISAETSTTSAPVSEIDDTWTDAMYEMFKEQYDSVQNDIIRWKLPPATVVNIIKSATDGTWQPKGNVNNVDMKTREGFEKIGILPKNIRLIYAFMEKQKNGQKTA